MVNRWRDLISGMFYWCDSENLQVQTCSSEQYSASHFLSLSTTQHPALKYLKQHSSHFILGGCDLLQNGLCLPFKLYQFPYCSCGWVCGWTLLVPHQCFSESFGLWSVSLQDTESCPDQQALTIVLSTTSAALLCWALLSHFLSVCLQLSIQTVYTHVVFFSKALLL